MNVCERFLKYISFDTKSDEASKSVPSTKGQLVLGEFLVEELKNIGLKNSHMDQNGYVYAFLPASKGCENLPAIGFIAHLDTSPDVSGKNVSPVLLEYKGGDIVLKSGSVIKEKEYPFISSLIGQTLITTDGTTLLGSDDKAGVAEITEAMHYLITHPEIKHPAISVAFTPDEEIGSGADLLDLEKFGAAWAYTIDGGALGEIEYENFNAASAVITVNGINIHPGAAKGKMKNALLLANEFIAMMPPAETPAHTDGYEGFYHICDMTANESKAEFAMIIRDHSKENFEHRKSFVINLANYLNGRYGENTFSVKITDSYYNMKEKILPHMHIIEEAKTAMLSAGVEPLVVPIRGGTDGARLSFRGLPCPNLSTGGYNFHSIYELIPTSSLEKMVEIIVNIASI